ncbi:SDR family NAD(P)-dependent oxidoreductase [Nocardia uniformis]|uniref:SDR family NAD(P)-dependent oxidoreductase n=1 Tax=Nocardia uniformis TaxID=53432 RepID=A0A849BZX2_9NOCA|nr:SDR family NAD(P)-dependent oxidoreductase [Nocardia uniformis]NNH69187.1 SDR family NAD(P)-dependent oxidoreductase [Nocardia uniformis]
MRMILITGATSGVGRAAALQLGEQGHHLVLVGRSPDRLATTAAAVRAAGAGAVDALECDMGSLDQVRQLAKTVQANYSRIDVLANNAGGFHMTRTETEDGIEATFAVNHLGGFLLTELLLDLLLHSSPARILFTSSVMHFGAHLDFDDLSLRRGYSPQRAYSASKLANILYVRDLGRRLEGTGVTANAFHPGAVATNIWDSAPWLVRPALSLVKRVFMISPEEGGRRLTFLATDPEVGAVSGGYFQRDRVKTPGRAARDDAAARRLRRACEELTGLAE